MNQHETNFSQDPLWCNNWFQIPPKAKFVPYSAQARMQFWLRLRKFSKTCMWSAYQIWHIMGERTRTQRACSLHEQRIEDKSAQQATLLVSWTRMSRTVSRGLWVAEQQPALALLQELVCTHLLKWPETSVVINTAVKAEWLHQLLYKNNLQGEEAVAITELCQSQWRVASSKSLPLVLPVFHTWAASKLQWITLHVQVVSSQECPALKLRLWPRCKHRHRKRKAIDSSTLRVKSRCSRSQLTR